MTEKDPPPGPSLKYALYKALSLQDYNDNQKTVE